MSSEQNNNQEENKNQNKDKVDAPVCLDDEKIYNLPKKEKVDLNDMYHRLRDENKKSDTIYTKEVKKLIEDIDKVFHSHIFVWQSTEDWKFNLPNTIFTGQEPPIKFFQPEQVYGTNVLSKLTPDQLKQIREKGEFVIGQSEDNLTTWRLNSWIIRGQQYMKKCLYAGLAGAWHQIIQIKCRIAPRFARNYGYFTKLANPNLLDGLISIYSLAHRVLNLTFGMRKVVVFNKNEVRETILKERNRATIKQHHQRLNDHFFEYIFEHTYYGDKKYNINKVNEIEKEKADFKDLVSEFKFQAEKLDVDKLKQMEKQNVDEDAALLEIFLQKQQLLFDLIKSGKYIKDINVQQHLINLITATQITRRHYTQYETDFKNKKNEIEQEIYKKHPIKSLVTLWRIDLLKKLLKPVRNRMITDCNQRILKELTEQNLKSEIILFQRFVEYQQSEKQIYKDNVKRIQKQSTQPSRVFETFEKFFKPYRIVEKQYSSGETYYEYLKGKTYKTPTSFFGWRLVLQLLRYKVWTKNVFVNLIENLIGGGLGLKKLFYLHPFSRGNRLNSRTGVEESMGTINPYIQVLKNVWTGIRRTIADFEAQPDRGIFGKNFSRVFKYIECYIFRLLIVGVILVGIGLPIAIVVNCIASFVLAVTSWLWIPLTLTLRYLIHLLLWDFDSPTRYGFNSYAGCHQTYQTFQPFPLINGVITLGLGVFEILVSLTSMVAIHPTLSILSTVFSLLRRASQGICDKIMNKLVSKIGRQPELDTFIAWKIRGTGLTRQYTYSISIEDVKILVRGRLELIELEEYEKRLIQKIKEPDDTFYTIAKNLFVHYGYEGVNSSYISSNISKLKSILSKQIQERKTVYPKPPSSCSIKFTEQELSEIFFECQNMLQQFIEQRKMNWIFKNFYIEEQDITQLIEKILIDTFKDENIIYPISELDKRIEIKKEKNSQFSSIQRAMDGETQLRKYTAQIKQVPKKFRKPSLFPFVDAETIQMDTLRMNSDSIHYNQYSDPYGICFYFSHKDYEEISQQDKADKKKD